MSFRYNMTVIIDAHTHIFPPKIRDNRQQYLDADPCFAGLYAHEKAKLATVEDLIDSMDREEIDRSVILNIGWLSHDICVETNDYIMECVARYPARLTGFCAVQPRAGENALKEIERCVAGGIRGVGELRPDVQDIDLNDPGFLDEMTGLMIRHDLAFLTHASEPVGHQYQGKGQVTPYFLYPFITAYPELKIILAHWGGGFPFYCLMPEVKKAAQNVYFDTAASPYLYSREIYNHVIGLAGPDKILFGTDYPLLRPGRLLDEIHSLDISDEVRQMILADNTRRVLALD